MSSKAIAALVLGTFAFGAQAAETFYTGFGTLNKTSAGALSSTALGSFAAGSLANATAPTDATLILEVTGASPDAVARFNFDTYLTLDFALLAPANLITVSFYASGAGNANVRIDGGPVQSQAITQPTPASPQLGIGGSGTFVTKAFSGSFAAGTHTLRIDNDPAVGYRLDDITVTAVPEPGTYAMLLAGLAAVGFVAKRRAG